MAAHLFFSLYFLLLRIPLLIASRQDFSILDYDPGFNLFRADYTPPTPPTPAPPPRPPSVSCQDLNGIGSLNTTCELSSSLNLTGDVYVEGRGNLFFLQGVALICPKLGCSIGVNITGDLRMNSFSKIVAGSVYVLAGNASLFGDSMINVTARASDPEGPSRGTPVDAQGGGGGHGGRGASCVMDNKKLPEDVWGGDAYAWDGLEAPWSYGSKGGSTSKDERYGGRGGGRIWLEVKDTVDMQALLLADGGDGGIKGGGGSGGSIFIKAKKM